MVSLELMRKTADLVNSDPSLKQQIRGPLSFQFNLEGERPFYLEVAADGSMRIVEGSHGSPTAVLIASDETMANIIKGELDPVRAYLRGELKIMGDVFASQRIGSLLARLRGRI